MPSYHCRWVKCGKAGCKSCPHGPYWYEYWYEQKKTKSRYHGKKRPQPERPAPEPPPPPDPWDAVFDRRTISLPIAYAVLGIDGSWDHPRALTRYRELQLAWHPDRGGPLKRAMQLNCAWEYIRSIRGW